MTHKCIWSTAVNTNCPYCGEALLLCMLSDCNKYKHDRSKKFCDERDYPRKKKTIYFRMIHRQLVRTK